MPSLINATTTNGLVTSADNSGSLQLQTNNGTTAVTIDTSQNVGIGTSSPATRLDVNGTVRSAPFGSTSLTSTFALNSTTTTDGTTAFPIGSITGAFTGSAYSTASMRFNTVNDSGVITERMRITSGGDVLVGGTGQASAGNSYVTLRGGDNNCIETYRIGTGTRTHNAFYNGTAGSAVLVGTIQTSGSNTSYNTSSDYRLKENIAPMTGALAKVAQLKPVTYTWKSDGSDGQGFIAHELQAVVPDCVTGEKDAVETYIDEEGNEQTRPVYQGVDTSFLVATLTAALQEAHGLIKDLQARVETLEAK